MDSYSVLATAAVAAPRTIGTLIASTARRGHVEAFSLSCEGAPADNTIIWKLQRCTTTGTVTSTTPAAKDPASPAASLSSGQNASAEPTYTANTILWEGGLNQRSLARIVYAPGKELLTNTTSNNGMGMTANHASATPTVDAVFEWTE